VKVGYFGFSWSSAFYDSGDHYRGLCLDFHSQSLDPSCSDYRGYGFPLRCLSE